MSNPAIKQPPSSILEKLVGQRIVRVQRRRLGENPLREQLEVELQDGTLLVPGQTEDGAVLQVLPRRGPREVL